MKKNKNTSDENLNRDIHKNAAKERFPESSMSKSSREDADKMEKTEADIEGLAEDVSGTPSRTTGTSAEDIAGVADLDKGMRRAEKK